MKKGKLIKTIERENDEEVLEWYRMTPQERLQKSQELWAVYLAFGGSLDPEPDTQSPFSVLWTKR